MKKLLNVFSVICLAVVSDGFAGPPKLEWTYTVPSKPPEGVSVQSIGVYTALTDGRGGGAFVVQERRDNATLFLRLLWLSTNGKIRTDSPVATIQVPVDNYEVGLIRATTSKVDVFFVRDYDSPDEAPELHCFSWRNGSIKSEMHSLSLGEVTALSSQLRDSLGFFTYRKIGSGLEIRRYRF